VQAAVTFAAVAVVVLNLLVDLTYGYLDPRIRYG
jgi:ABC-type dipeptide/oligopeptide/nickel transport system permease component